VLGRYHNGVFLRPFPVRIREALTDALQISWDVAGMGQSDDLARAVIEEKLFLGRDAASKSAKQIEILSCRLNPKDPLEEQIHHFQDLLRHQPADDLDRHYELIWRFVSPIKSLYETLMTAWQPITTGITAADLDKFWSDIREVYNREATRRNWASQGKRAASTPAASSSKQPKATKAATPSGSAATTTPATKPPKEWQELKDWGKNKHPKERRLGRLADYLRLNGCHECNMWGHTGKHCPRMAAEARTHHDTVGQIQAHQARQQQLGPTDRRSRPFPAANRGRDRRFFPRGGRGSPQGRNDRRQDQEDPQPEEEAGGEQSGQP
jgi:hypothetical protein